MSSKRQKKKLSQKAQQRAQQHAEKRAQYSAEEEEILREVLMDQPDEQPTAPEKPKGKNKLVKRIGIRHKIRKFHGFSRLDIVVKSHKGIITELIRNKIIS